MASAFASMKKVKKKNLKSGVKSEKKKTKDKLWQLYCEKF